MKREEQEIFLHICCGPCALGTLPLLRAEGYRPQGFYYNPNIHPYQEYRRRRDALSLVSQFENLPVIYSPKYDMEEYLKRVAANPVDRCVTCYRLRLKEAAEEAKARGFGTFTTTLLASPWQKHDLVVEIGEQVARETGVSFLARDFRPYYPQGIQRAKILDVYRQPYCGCIYSEKERFAPPHEKSNTEEK